MPAVNFGQLSTCLKFLLSYLPFATVSDVQRCTLFHHCLFSEHLRGVVQIHQMDIFAVLGIKIKLSCLADGAGCAEASLFSMHDWELSSSTERHNKQQLRTGNMRKCQAKGCLKFFPWLEHKCGGCHKSPLWNRAQAYCSFKGSWGQNSQENSFCLVTGTYG